MYALLGVLGAISLGSLGLNVFLYKKAKAPARRQQTQELQEFVADLMQGKLGMIAVARVNPDDVLYKTPRRGA